MSKTLGLRPGISFKASSPEANAPTHRMSGAVPSSCTICFRNSPSSSTTATDFTATDLFKVMLVSFAVILLVSAARPGIWLDQRDDQLQMDRGSLTGPALHHACPANILHTAFHIGQAIP